MGKRSIRAPAGGPAFLLRTQLVHERIVRPGEYVTVHGRGGHEPQQRTGHGDAMKQKYRRTAATWLAQKQGDLVPLHRAIPELAKYAVPIARRRQKR